MDSFSLFDNLRETFPHNRIDKSKGKSMNTLLIIFFTLVIYSVISTVAYLLSGQNENVLCYFGLGIVGLLIEGICRLIDKVRRFFRYHGKRSILENLDTGIKYQYPPSRTDQIWAQEENIRIVKRYAIKEEWKQYPVFPNK